MKRAILLFAILLMTTVPGCTVEDLERISQELDELANPHLELIVTSASATPGSCTASLAADTMCHRIVVNVVNGNAVADADARTAQWRAESQEGRVFFARDVAGSATVPAGSAADVLLSFDVMDGSTLVTLMYTTPMMASWLTVGVPSYVVVEAERGPQPIIAIDGVAVSPTAAVFRLVVDFPSQDIAFAPDDPDKPPRFLYHIEELRLNPGPNQFLEKVVGLDGSRGSLLFILTENIATGGLCMAVDAAGPAGLCDSLFDSWPILEIVDGPDPGGEDATVPAPGGILLRDVVGEPGTSLHFLVQMGREPIVGPEWSVAIAARTQYVVQGAAEPAGSSTIDVDFVLRDGGARSKRLAGALATLPAHATPGIASTPVTDRPAVTVTPLAASAQRAYLRVLWTIPPHAPKDGPIAGLGSGAVLESSEIVTAGITRPAGAVIMDAIPLSRWTSVDSRFDPLDPDLLQYAAGALCTLGGAAVGAATAPTFGSVAGTWCTFLFDLRREQVAEAQEAAQAQLRTDGVLLANVAVEALDQWTHVEFLVIVAPLADGSVDDVFLTSTTVFRRQYVAADEPRLGITSLPSSSLSICAYARRHVDYSLAANFRIQEDQATLDRFDAFPPAVAWGGRRGSIYAGICSPARLLIEDDEGRAIGWRNGEQVTEIPGAHHVVIAGKDVYELPDDEYRYRVIGTGVGEYALSLTRYGSAEGDVTSLYVANVTTRPGLVDHVEPATDWTGLQLVAASDAPPRVFVAGATRLVDRAPALTSQVSLDVEPGATARSALARVDRTFTSNPGGSIPRGASHFVGGATFVGPSANPSVIDLSSIARHHEQLNATHRLYRLTATDSWEAVGVDSVEASPLVLSPSERVTLGLFAMSPASGFAVPKWPLMAGGLVLLAGFVAGSVALARKGKRGRADRSTLAAEAILDDPAGHRWGHVPGELAQKLPGHQSGATHGAPSHGRLRPAGIDVRTDRENRVASVPERFDTPEDDWVVVEGDEFNPVPGGDWETVEEAAGASGDETGWLTVEDEWEAVPDESAKRKRARGR